MEKSKVYHVSHVDADGYGCNVVMDKFQETEGTTIKGYDIQETKSYSANYRYLKNQLLNIIEEMVQDDKDTEKLLLITDVNLTDEVTDSFEKDLEKLKEHNIKIQVIDHHGTGLKIINKYNKFKLLNQDNTLKEYEEIQNDMSEKEYETLTKLWEDYKNTKKELLKDKSKQEDLIDLEENLKKSHEFFEYVSENQDNWYDLNTKNSATKNFFEVMKEENIDKVNKQDLTELHNFVEFIDNYDLYKEPLSDDWLKGSTFQELSFTMAGMYDTNNFIKKMSSSEGKLPETDRKKFLSLDQQKIKSIVNVYKEVQKLMEQGIDLPTIRNEYLTDIFMNELNNNIKKENESDNLEFSSILDRNDIDIREKKILINNKLYGYESSSIKFLDKTKTKTDITKNFNRMIDFTFPYAVLPELNKEVKEKFLSFDLESKNIDEIKKDIKINIHNHVKEIIESNEEITSKYNNENMPTDMLIALSFGKIGIDNILTNKNLSREVFIPEMNSSVKICLNVHMGFFQHASFAYGEEDNNNTFISFDMKRGVGSARSSNETAAKVAQVFGGGGHPNAGGFNVDFLSLDEKELFNTKVHLLNDDEKKLHKKLIKNIQQKILDNLVKKIEENFTKEIQEEEIKSISGKGKSI